MRHPSIRACAALVLLMTVVPVFATGHAQAVPYSSHSESLRKLQRKVDELVGRRHLEVARDFIGARLSDPSTWCWTNSSMRGIAVSLIEGKAKLGAIGWYEDTDAAPVLNGINDGVVIEGLRKRNTPTLVRMPPAVKRFGFYVVQKAEGKKHRNDPPILLFTNNQHNNLDNTATSELVGADKQMLVYDVSRWLGPRTWLVACPSPDRDEHPDREDDDDESNYLLFTVTGPSVTPAQTKSFGQVKAMFR